MIKVPLDKPSPDIEKFVKVIRGEVIPETPPFAELFLDYEILREIYRTYLGGNWVEPGSDRESWEAYLKNSIEVYYRLGYDYFRMSGGIEFPGKGRLAADTTGGNVDRGQRGWAEEGFGMISSWEDFENYPWPDPAKSDISLYEFVANNLPEGMGLFVCPASGFFEVPVGAMLGYEGLCYMLYDNPELVEAVFTRCAEAMLGLYQRLVQLPNLYGLFQGDDMGYKTGLMIGADQLRKYVLPWHNKLAALTHENGMLYLLHSCGNLEEIMEDLIEDVRIDARHSFEDEGNSILDAKRKYGSRIAVLGGIDVDKLCRMPEPELRVHVRKTIDACLPGGRFALGTGNTMCNYIPIPSYLAMLEEGLNYA